MMTVSSLNAYKNYINENRVYKGNEYKSAKDIETMMHSFKNVIRHYEKLSASVDFIDGSIEDQLRKGEMSESEIKSLYRWIFEHHPTQIFKFEDFEKEYIQIFQTSMSIDELKEKFLILKSKQEEYYQAFETSRSIKDFEERAKEIEEKYSNKDKVDDKNIQDKENSENIQKVNLNKDNINKDNATSKEPNPFTPIQAESKSETFTYDDIAKNFFLTFLENERKKGNDVLELLENLFKVDKNKVDLKA